VADTRNVDFGDEALALVVLLAEILGDLGHRLPVDPGVEELVEFSAQRVERQCTTRVDPPPP